MHPAHACPAVPSSSTRARRWLGLALLCSSIACDDGAAPKGEAPPTPSATAPTPKAEAKPEGRGANVAKVEAAIRAAYGPYRTAKDDGLPKECPKLDGAEVLMLAGSAAVEILGTKQQTKFAFFDAQVTPPALSDFPRGLTDAAAERLAKTSHVAFVSFSEHEPAERLNDTTGASGKLGGWVVVAQGQAPKGLCRFPISVENSPTVLTTAHKTKVKGLEGIDVTGTDEDLARNFALALAKTIEAAGGTLVDETGPVTESKRNPAPGG